MADSTETTRDTRRSKRVCACTVRVVPAAPGCTGHPTPTTSPATPPACPCALSPAFTSQTPIISMTQKDTEREEGRRGWTGRPLSEGVAGRWWGRQRLGQPSPTPREFTKLERLPPCLAVAVALQSDGPGQSVAWWGWNSGWSAPTQGPRSAQPAPSRDTPTPSLPVRSPSLSQRSTKPNPQ